MKAIARTVARAFSRVSPDTFVFNYLNTAPRFAYCHGRLPRSPQREDAGLQDLIFWNKISPPSYFTKFCVDKEFAKYFVSGFDHRLSIPTTYQVVRIADIRSADHLADILEPYRGMGAIAKPTHLCGYEHVIFLRENWTRQRVAQLLEGARADHFYMDRETQYHRLQKKIIIEQEITSSGDTLVEYKLYCSRGSALFCLVNEYDYVDQMGRTGVFSIPDFVMYDIRFGNPIIERRLQRPERFTDMIEIAENLSAGMDFVRVDLYLSNNEIFFSELTFTPTGGNIPFSDEEFSRTMLRRVTGHQCSEGTESAFGSQGKAARVECG